jgi:hypothetical protein
LLVALVVEDGTVVVREVVVELEATEHLSALPGVGFSLNPLFLLP